MPEPGSPRTTIFWDFGQRLVDGQSAHDFGLDFANMTDANAHFFQFFIIFPHLFINIIFNLRLQGNEDILDPQRLSVFQLRDADEIQILVVFDDL